MAPPVTPSRTGVCIHGRCRVHARCRIERIFINHHWRRRYNDGDGEPQKSRLELAPRQRRAAHFDTRTVRFWLKADIACALHMSAFDPKRTLIALPATRFYRYDGSSAIGAAMRRREFITLLSSTTVIWPIATWAQQRGQVARIGVLMSAAANDPEGPARITAFRQALQKLGWTEGQNVRIEVRWAGGEAALDRKFATELAALTPDVILATASQTVAALQAVTQTVPIVFAHAVDPVGAGFVDNLARPGGNATGFVLFEYGMGAKWLELLKEIAPNVTRVAVLRDPTIAAGIGQLALSNL